MHEWTLGAGSGLASVEAQTSLSAKPIGELSVLWQSCGGQLLLQAVARATSESSVMGKTTPDQGHILPKWDTLK